MRPGAATTRALAWLDAFVTRRSASPAQAGLLRLVVEEGQRQAAVSPRGLPAAELPLAVYAAAGGPDPAPLPHAAACLCVYLGADLLDNVVDRELSDRWSAAGANQAILAGVTFLTPLAAAALAELSVSAETRLAAQDALVDGLLIMSAGQSADVAFEGRGDVTLEMCEAMVLAKSGAEAALFARLGALLAGAPAASRDAYGRFGQEFGAASQLISDGADIAAEDGGRDLETGKRTLPVVFALSALPAAARANLLDHLAAAPRDPARRRAARDVLLAAGALHFVTLVAEAHRQRALAALREAGAAGPGAALLYDWLDDFRLAQRGVPRH